MSHRLVGRTSALVGRASVPARLLLLPAFGCAEPLEDPTPYLDAPRVLGVVVEPAEAEPGDPITLRALYAGADGPVADAPLDWGFCLAPKPLAELGPVATTCLQPDSADLSAIGSGEEVAATLPIDACSLFGPNPPPPVEGEPSGRPTDPDVTGGFYQPALAFDAGAPTLASPRVRCGLANVSQEAYIAWNQGYVSNVNPAITAFTAEDAVFASGNSVELSITWASESAETYVVYDAATDSLDSRREGLSAAWFATAGTFDEPRTGISGDDAATESTNGWIAPDEPGDVWIAVVLRDERGGTAFASGWVTVTP